MTLHLPQLILASLMLLNLGVAIAEHGKPRSPSSAWHTIWPAVLLTGLLWWGGFWR